MIEVKNPGLYCSLQDFGRFGYRRFGVPLSGVMDRLAAGLANKLVGNEIEATVLEFTNPGPTLLFMKSALISITGAGFVATLNGDVISKNTILEVAPNSVLKMGKTNKGVWGYLAINGGFITEKILGSCSFYSGITPYFRLNKGAYLKAAPFISLTSEKSHEIIPLTEHTSEMNIEVYKGPEYYILDETMKDSLLKCEFTISHNSNRMAYLLEHSVQLSAKEIITAPVQPGTLQLTPSGKMVVLMRDSQTTGGYARIFQLTEAAINTLSQKRAGEKVQFRLL